MPLQIIEPDQPVEVRSTSFMIYGVGGSGKTSLAQTAEAPLTLDFDNGIHRSGNRKRAIRVDAWTDMLELAKNPAILKGHKTLNVDTVGRMLDCGTAHLIATDRKAGSATGGLTIQGWGMLKSLFQFWVNQMRQNHQIDLVFISHEKEEKEGDNRYFRPDIQGGSYSEVMKFCDFVGRISFDKQGRRILDFTPSDVQIGKNSANWKPMILPSFAERPHLLADLIADAKASMGGLSEESAKVAAEVKAWTDFLDADPSLPDLNAKLAELKKVTDKSAKQQIWNAVTTLAAKGGLEFDAKNKVFFVAKPITGNTSPDDDVHDMP